MAEAAKWLGHYYREQQFSPQSVSLCWIRDALRNKKLYLPKLSELTFDKWQLFKASFLVYLNSTDTTFQIWEKVLTQIKYFR